jgi:uncharacterized protein YwgA
MTRYQLAKLIEWAGTLRTRKKMQKVVFLLQAAGAPLGAEFGLHYYGPYSQELAQLVDEMVRLGLLAEAPVSNAAGQEYHYVLTEQARAKLAEAESNPRSRALAAQMAPYAEKARGLLAREVKDLELASTLVFFRQQGLEWALARAKTCQVKSLRPDDPFLQSAEGLARQIVA